MDADTAEFDFLVIGSRSGLDVPSLRDRLDTVRGLLEDEEVRSISRRYFISNGFDGPLTSIGVGVCVLFAFGAYLGSISKQNWIVAGVRMGLAGIVVTVLNLFLPG